MELDLIAGGDLFHSGSTSLEERPRINSGARSRMTRIYPRRGVGAQHDSRIGRVESVPFITRRMMGRDVQRSKLSSSVSTSGDVYTWKPMACQMPLIRCKVWFGVQSAERLPSSGKRHIQPLFPQVTIERRHPKLLLSPGKGVLRSGLNIVGSLADSGWSSFDSCRRPSRTCPRSEDRPR